MPETNENQAPEENTREAARPEGELREELARVRGKNNTLKVVAAVLLSLFIILSAVGFLVYRKISSTKAAFEEAFQSFPPPAPGYQPENRQLPFGQAVSDSTGMPASTLGLFSGSLPGAAGPGFDPAQGEQLVKTMNKYAERPIVKEFIADLKKNPDMAAAFDATKGGNPLAVLALVRNAKGMDKIMMKYATRPEFMKLMMEAMNDPDLKPYMKGMPGGMPQAGALPIATGSQPRVSLPEGEADPEITFDASVISGPAKPAPASAKRGSQPVDSDR